MLNLLIACSAPEVMPPERQLSPAELGAKGSVSIIENTPQEEASIAPPQANVEDEADKTIRPDNKDPQSEKTNVPPPPPSELEDLTPPYTAWTRDESAIRGPGGAVLFTVRSGTRVEVLQKNNNNLQILCSGCLSPRENHGGWISLFELETPQTSDNGLLALREQWARGEELPDTKGDWDKEDLCRLFDNGYQAEGTLFIFSNSENTLMLIEQDQQWSISELNIKTTQKLNGRGCGIQRSKINNFEPSK